MRWFKIETDILTNPKINSLSPSDLKMWLYMLALAAKNDGNLPDAEGIAKALSRRLDHVLKALLSLSKRGLIESYEGGYVPHNWQKYQAGSYSSAKRMRKLRAKSDEKVTPQNRIEETREDKKEASLRDAKKEGLSKKGLRRTQIAENADPSNSDVAVGERAGMLDETLEFQWGKFRAHHRAKGSLMADWGQAWVTWVTNWKGYGSQQAQASGVNGAAKKYDWSKELAMARQLEIEAEERNRENRRLA